MTDYIGTVRSVTICRYCDQVIVDGRVDSGANEYDPMTLDGDYGCGDSPDTNEDGTGGHDPITIWDVDRKDKGSDLANDWRRVTETFTVLV